MTVGTWFQRFRYRRYIYQCYLPYFQNRRYANRSFYVPTHLILQPHPLNERPVSDRSQVVTRRPLRKTFGRQVYNMNSENSELALVKLMELFNHSSIAITKRYLGLRQEEILQTYDCLTFWFFCKENIRHSHLFVKFVAIPIQQWQGRTFWTQRCYWNHPHWWNSRKISLAVKMIAMAPHHWSVQPVVASYISFGVGYCFIQQQRQCEKPHQ